jgi:glucarate dehydratase
MKLTPVAIADPPLRSSYGLHAPYALRTIVELRSEDGLVGIAEAHGGAKALADFERVRPSVVGADAYGLSRLARAVEDALRGPSVTRSNGAVDRSQTHFVPGENPSDVPLRIYAALEVAALDLIGRAQGVPVCDLLGGRVRDEIPFAAYLFYKHAGGGGEGDDAREDEYGEAMSPAGIVAQARSMTAKFGFTSYKLKAGVLEPEVEVETILALRDAFGPGAPQRIDPNAAWSHETALEVATKLYGKLEYLEDPVAGIEGMGRLHDAMRAHGIPIPLASNVAVTNFGDLPESIRRNAVQIVLGDHHYWGGPRAIVQLGRLAETFGIGLSMHSNSHLGISLVAMAHVAAATPQLTFACDTHYPWQSDEDEVVEGGRIPIAGGNVRVPAGPGLGVTIDRDRLARGRERYERVPYRKRDDTAEMRKHVDPSWKRLVPAW